MVYIVLNCLSILKLDNLSFLSFPIQRSSRFPTVASYSDNIYLYKRVGTLPTIKDDNYFMDAFLAIVTTPTKIQKFTRRTPPPPPFWELRMFWCFDQSCVNRTESVHGTLCFLFLSQLQCMEYVWKSSLWIGTFQSAHRPAVVCTAAAVVSTINSVVCMYFPEKNKGNWAKWIIRKEWRRLFTLHFRAHKHLS